MLINVQYSQKAIFSFEKGSTCQNHSSSDSLHPVKNPPVKFSIFLGTTFPLPSLTGKCHWEIQKSLGDARGNIKWEIYNE